MVPLPKSVSLSNSILLILLKLHGSYWLKKNNTFQSTRLLCWPVQYINQTGVLSRMVTTQIFFEYKPIFYIKIITHTEVQWQSNPFWKICKNLSRQGAILQFQFHLFNFLPIFQNKFFDNCKCHIYIICSKNWT